MGKLISDLTTFIVGLIETLLVARFVLKLFAANPAAGFVSWIYETSVPLLRPFLLAFPTPSVRGGYQLEFSTLFAIFAYAFAGFLIQEFLYILQQHTRKGVKR
ncbi:MAG: YggT family protein [bacterium]|nr:YggT family protein [bacterium]